MRAPLVTWALAALCVLVAWQVTGFLPTEATLEPVAWSQEAMREGAWWKLLTATVAHTGPLHLVFNLLSLLALGAAVERSLGPARTAILLLAAGVVGNLAHGAVSDVPVVGASGMIFGLVGLLMILTPTERVEVLLFLELPVAVVCAFYTAAVFLVPAFSQALPIAHGAHLGGLVAGALAGVGVDARAALRHAPWVAGIFVGAFVVVGWAIATDVRALPGAWEAGGFAGVLGMSWPLVLGTVGIVVSLGVLGSGGREEDGR